MPPRPNGFHGSCGTISEAMSNPWLRVPLRDYEGHMAQATVAVEPHALRSALAVRGFACWAERSVRLESGKEFLRAAFRLNANSAQPPASAPVAANQ